MSTRTTFEDRLLGELTREIELREAESGTHEDKAAGASARRLSTPRRIAVVAAACVAAWVGAVVVPGSPTGSKAYAVELHSDGSVEVVFKDPHISVADQQELASEVGPWGIHVEVDVLDPGYTCKPWGQKATLDLEAVNKWGAPVPVRAWKVTLNRGDLLAFENTKGSSQPRAITRYEVESFEVNGETEPCVPVKRALPKN